MLSSDPVVVARLNAPRGIDYHTNSNSLIVSFNCCDGLPTNFVKVAASGATNSWSTLSGMGDSAAEIKLATVKTTANGWTQGDMYFGTAQTGTIGKISADGSSVNTNWATLPGETNLLGGGFYIDQTGVWNGDLIVVAAGNTNHNVMESGGGVWRVPCVITRAPVRRDPCRAETRRAGRADFPLASLRRFSTVHSAT